MIKEEIRDVCSFDIEQLNSEGWSVVQVIGRNYQKEPRQKKIKYQEGVSTVGLPLFEEDPYYTCLLRKAE